jgi:hypothetical protein
MNEVTISRKYIHWRQQQKKGEREGIQVVENKGNGCRQISVKTYRTLLAIFDSNNVLEIVTESVRMV